MIFTKHDEQPWHEWRPGVMTRLWSGGSTGAIAMHVGEQFFEPGTGVPLHWHYYEEHVSLISGKAEVYVDGERAVLEAGATVVFLPQAVHGFRNIGDEKLHIFGATNWPVNETFFVNDDGEVVDTMRWWQHEREGATSG